MAQKKNMTDILNVATELTKENIKKELPSILEDIPIVGPILKIVSNVAIGTMDRMNEEEPDTPALETKTKETFIKEKETIVEEIRAHEFTEDEIEQIKQILYSQIQSSDRQPVYYSGFIVYSRGIPQELQEIYTEIFDEEYSCEDEEEQEIEQEIVDEVVEFRNDYLEYACITDSSINFIISWDNYDDIDMLVMSSAGEYGMHDKMIKFIHNLNMIASLKENNFPMFMDYTVY